MFKTSLVLSTIVLIASTCATSNSRNEEMIKLISSVQKTEYSEKNDFCPEAQIAYYESAAETNLDPGARNEANYNKATAFLKLGNELNAISVLEDLLGKTAPYERNNMTVLMRDLAISYLRLGEKANCVRNHGASSCIFPIKDEGIHSDQTGSEKAAAMFAKILEQNPGDLESRWLLNIAYMTMGTYPRLVPGKYLIPGLDEVNNSGLVKPFTDVAINMGLNANNMAGGSIVDDFNNDGYLDIVTSSMDLKENMHYCKNNGNGTFTDISEASGLQKFTGGLNMMQTDYNNDGLKDIFVLRGGWKREFGREPNSLLLNNGDGTFTDVTKEAGLLSFHPTQTATWNDFNNDGWLDVFIGNESAIRNDYDDDNACELYINNKNGTFTNIAVESKTNIKAYVKGVTSGDYDNDGWVDIFISTMQNRKYLLKNLGSNNGSISFKDVTLETGLGVCNVNTFPTWFWDYDNDGWLDIFVSNYQFNTSLAWYTAAEALHLRPSPASHQFLFRNNHDGTFKDVSDEVGLNKVAFAMGANFGDIDNDGYPDIYLGTGNPQYQSLVPNKMFKNMGGTQFADVTSAARVGNLQKGHGVSFCDLDNDGDEDIYIEMGGAYVGDAYDNSLYINPGQSSNHWINLQLEGVQSNKAAIGAKIKVTFKENGITRSVYKDVTSGGSFGSNPLVQHIGLGTATAIESVEVKWPVSHKTQVFRNIRPGDYVSITEGNDNCAKKLLNKINFLSTDKTKIGCTPN